MFKKEFGIGIFNIRIETELPDFLEIIDKFIDCRNPPNPNNSINIEYLVTDNTKEETSQIFIQHEIDSNYNYVSMAGEGIAVAATDLKSRAVKARIFKFNEHVKEAIIEIIFMKPLRAILAESNLFFLHAALLQNKQNEGLLIAGPSRSGKSTFSIHLAKAGLQLLNDDDCFFTPRANKFTFYSLPTAIGISEQILSNYPELEKEVIKDFVLGRKKRIRNGLNIVDLDPRDMQCKAIIFPHFSSQDSFAINPIPQEEAIATLMSDTLPRLSNSILFPESHKKHIASIFALTKNTKLYKITYNDNNTCQAIETILNLF